MNAARDVSHALLLGASEVDSAQMAATLDLARPCPTALRGPVALADACGTVFARGVIEAVEPHEIGGLGGPGTYHWRLIGVEAAPQRFALRGRLIGPLWARLSLAERQALAGQLSPDNADQFGREAEPSDETTANDLTAGDAEQVVEDLAPLTTVSPAEAVDASAVPEGDEAVDTFAGPDATLDEDAAATEFAGVPNDQVGLEPQLSESFRESPPLANEENDPPVPSREEDETPAEQKPPLSLIEAARERGMAFVPERGISEDVARARLIELRETEIKPTFPNAKSTAGILRKTLLERLIDEAVESEEDFERLIPREVRVATDPDQIAAYLTPIVRILSKIR